MNLIFRFIWHVLTRFARTCGCLFFIAGVVVAAGLYKERAPMIDSVRYRQSNLLAARLHVLQSTYEDSQRLVINFKGTADFPSQYAAAAFKPEFPLQYASLKDFQDLQAQLPQVSVGKDAMKRFVTDHLESMLSEIEQKLVAHAASLAPASQSPPPKRPALGFGLYEGNINPSEANSRKSTLEEAKQFLGVLQSSAENEENKKKLGDSIAELDSLLKLLPSTVEPPLASPPKQPLNAEKVAVRIATIRNNVRRAVLSSWALDEATDRVLQTAEEEHGKFLSSEFQVKHFSEELHVKMAMAITAGVALGTFFLLIGDWTQKSSTLIHFHWCQLIKDYSASPKEVYDIIEQHVAKRKVPEVDIAREFWHEGGALSAKRQYLRFSRERLMFEVCAAPFGTGFFVSFRCVEKPLVIDPLAIFLVLMVGGGALGLLVQALGLMWGATILVFCVSLLVFVMRTTVLRGLSNVDRVLMKTPLLAPLYEVFLRPVTYYRIDSTAMYLQAMQGAIAEAFQSIFGKQEIDLLPEKVAQTVLDEIYRKRFYIP